MKGGNELPHDADIVVKVNKGRGIITKNRFAEGISTEFEVFPKK